MDRGLAILLIGSLLVASLLLRNAAARHVTAQEVPSCLQRRFSARNRSARTALLIAVGISLAGAVDLASAVASQIATNQ